MAWYVTFVSVMVLSFIMGREWDNIKEPDNELGIAPLGMFAMSLLIIMFLGSFIK